MQQGLRGRIAFWPSHALARALTGIAVACQEAGALIADGVLAANDTEIGLGAALRAGDLRWLDQHGASFLVSVRRRKRALQYPCRICRIVAYTTLSSLFTTHATAFLFVVSHMVCFYIQWVEWGLRHMRHLHQGVLSHVAFLRHMRHMRRAKGRISRYRRSRPVRLRGGATIALRPGRQCMMAATMALRQTRARRLR